MPSYPQHNAAESRGLNHHPLIKALCLSPSAGQMVQQALAFHSGPAEAHFFCQQFNTMNGALCGKCSRSRTHTIWCEWWTRQAALRCQHKTTALGGYKLQLLSLPLTSLKDARVIAPPPPPEHILLMNQRKASFLSHLLWLCSSGLNTLWWVDMITGRDLIAVFKYKKGWR